MKRSKGPKNHRDNIFDALLHSDLPESEKATSRLQHEANIILAAGQDTTGESSREM